MRILIDVSVLELSATGVARAVAGLYTACRQVAPSLDLIGVHRNPLSAPLPAGMRDLRPGRRLPVRVWRPLALRWLGLTLRPDVVHFPWNGGVTRPEPGCLTVLTLHDLIPLALPALYFSDVRAEREYRDRARREVMAADLVLTDSESSRQDIIHHLSPPREPLVVTLATMLSEVSPEGARGVPSNHFIYFGGYERRKGLVELVRGFRKLFAAGAVSGPLWMVGESRVFSAEFGAELAAARAAGAVVEKGYLDDVRLAEALRGARALVYPSHYEGFGLPPLEAMGLGCPVITTRASSMPEVCGDAAVYVTPGAEEELSQAILRLDRDESLREELRSRGREQARRFTWERSARTYLAALGRLRPGLEFGDSAEGGNG